MRRFIVRFFALIGFLTCLLIFILGWSLFKLNNPSLALLSGKDNLVLNLTLGDQFLDEKSQGGGLIGIIKGHPMSVHTVISGIQHAAHDQKVKGIFINIDGNAFKIATTQEIRNAIKDFRKTGKFVYAYTDTFGDFSNGTGAYYLASSASKIWVMPLGAFNFNGIVVEVPFGKKAIDNFKIRPQFGRREEYKGMPESFLESDFTAPHRQNMQRILDSLVSQVIDDVAQDRNLKTQDVRDILNSAPHILKEAVTAKMIDEIGYKDQVKDAIEKTLGNKAEYVDFETYAKMNKETSHPDKIAVVYAEGTISKGKVAHNPLSDDVMMDAVEVAKSIREAGEDKDIKAIILRIDSGGGYPIPCELIDREIEKLKEKKPIIVSMANYAASGGYWIACHARKIVAQPTTITGSIGVYAGKIITQEFWDNYGLHWGEVHTGNNAQIWSTGQEFTEIGRQKFERYLDKIYTVFQEKVAEGRKLSPQVVHDLAKGQVWTGFEAKEKGLVDELGGLTTAIEIAKKEAGIAADTPTSLEEYPAPKSLFHLVFERQEHKDLGVFAQYPTFRLIMQQIDRLFSPMRAEVKIQQP
jgi:protease-4